MLQVSRRMHQHAASTLDQGFDNEGSELIGVLGQCFLEHIETRLVARPETVLAPVCVRDWNGQRRKEQGVIHVMEMCDSAHAHRPGIAVIAFGQVHKGGFLRPRHAALLPVLKGHFDRDLDGRCPVVGEKNFLEPPGRHLDQLFGKPNGRDV